MPLFIRVVKSQFGGRRNRRRRLRRGSLTALDRGPRDLEPPTRRRDGRAAWELYARQTVVALPLRRFLVKDVDE